MVDALQGWSRREHRRSEDRSPLHHGIALRTDQLGVLRRVPRGVRIRGPAGRRHHGEGVLTAQRARPWSRGGPRGGRRRMHAADGPPLNQWGTGDGSRCTWLIELVHHEDLAHVPTVGRYSGSCSRDVRHTGLDHPRHDGRGPFNLSVGTATPPQGSRRAQGYADANGGRIAFPVKPARTHWGLLRKCWS